MSNLHTYRSQGYLVLEEGLAKPRDLRSVEITLRNGLTNRSIQQSSCLMKLLTSRDIMSSVGLILNTDSEANHEIEISVINGSDLVRLEIGNQNFYNSTTFPLMSAENQPNHVMLVMVLSAKEKSFPLNILPESLSDKFRTEPFTPDTCSLIKEMVPNQTSFLISPQLFWQINTIFDTDPYYLLFTRYSGKPAW